MTDLSPCCDAGNVIVSGGLGALGSLVAAWLSAQNSKSHAPNLTLLGRSGRVADPHTLSILAECQNQVRPFDIQIHSQCCYCAHG